MNIESENYKKETGERHLVERDAKEELFPVVDKDGNVLDCMTRAEAHCGSKRLHPVVHRHVTNDNGAVYLQH